LCDPLHALQTIPLSAHRLLNPLLFGGVLLNNDPMSDLLMIADGGQHPREGLPRCILFVLGCLAAHRFSDL
jgi:hypothetical protein